MTRAEFVALCEDLATLEIQDIDAPMLATATR